MIRVRPKEPAEMAKPFALLICMQLLITWAAAEPALSATKDSPVSETITLPNLHQPAEILIDHWGVPHIYAKDEADLFFVQGFNAARDRLFQIDLWRRRGLGQLAEVFGPAFLEQDKATRLFVYRSIQSTCRGSSKS